MGGVPRLPSMLVLALCLVAGSAAAQPTTADAEKAAKLYGEGRKLLEQGKFEEALSKIEPSLQLFDSPNTELLKAHALRQLGRRIDAMVSYAHVMSAAGERMRAGEKRFQATLEEAGRWSAVLRAELSEVRIVVRNAPADAKVSLGSRAVDVKAQGDELRVQTFAEPGTVELAVRASDGRVATKPATLSPGGTADLAVDFADAKVPVTEPVVEPPPPPPPSSGAGIPVPPLPSFVAAGVGVLGFGAFAVFGAMSASKASDLDVCSPRCSEARRSDADEGRRDQTIANVGLVVGAAGLATAGVLWIVLGKSKEEPATASGISLGPGNLSVRGKF